jgi:Na+/proline symporter
MAIRSTAEMKWARRTYFAWYIPFYAIATLVSLYARLLIPNEAAFDAELALPAISLELLPSVAVGIVLAGLFAATMSTADSQIIACSASLTQDIAPRWRDSYTLSKVGTVGVTLVALLFALFGTSSVFGLVLSAWSMLAASLGPLLVIRALNLPARTPTALFVVVAGLFVALFWKLAGLGDANGDGLYEGVYEIMPGMVSGFVVYGMCRWLCDETKRSSDPGEMPARDELITDTD